MKKVLITGGAGFIGNEIIKQLYAASNFEITVLDVLTNQIHGENGTESYLYKNIKNKCNFIHGDIRDLKTVIAAVEGQDYIIHLAAETGTGQSMYEINQYNEVNIMGTSNLFQAISMLKDLKINKIILTSSRSVYGEGKYHCVEHGNIYPKSRSVQKMKYGDFKLYCPSCERKLSVLPTSEDSPVIPQSLYAFTKFAQEKMVETMCRALHIGYTIFRLQNVYGVGQSLKNPYTGILSIFSTLLKTNQKVNIFEDGKESRDFINVIDVARSVIDSLSNNVTNSEIINIGSGVGTSVLEIAEMLKKIYVSNSDIFISGDFRIGDIAHNLADITKAKKMINFNPDVPLEMGLKEFCTWVNIQDQKYIKYNQSLDEMNKIGMLIRGEK